MTGTERDCAGSADFDDRTIHLVPDCVVQEHEIISTKQENIAEMTSRAALNAFFNSGDVTA